jgi:bifunctional non-homologous end joining protein LigD
VAPRKTPTKQPAPLKDYRAKRDFTRTAEPEPEAGAGDGHAFVVQKHAARRLHYDLRLELDGVLKSWAVTRGPSLSPGEKRLAVRTEDHPVEYLTFEGNIPKGEYGGGTMIVWDRGQWQPDGDPHKGLTKGHLVFALEGARLKGRWHLVRMRPRAGEKTESWLLMKSEDEFARPPGAPEITDEETTSQLSGRTTEELAAEGELRSDHAARATRVEARKVVLPDFAKVAGARKGLLPTFLEPSGAAPCEQPPSGPKWVHEIKHDGYRIQTRLDGGRIRLLTRKALDWTARFGSIAAALPGLGLSSALIDGELVVQDANGFSSLNLLQGDLKESRQDRFRYLAFDLLYAEGFDLTRAKLVDRKRLLEQVIAAAPAGSPICFSEHLAVDGPVMLTHSCRLGLEGIVSKRIDLPYVPGRGEHWLKSKCNARQEFIILGHIPSTASRRAVGALALGYYGNGKLTYAGRVGTGWSSADAEALYQALEAITAPRPALAKPMPAGMDKGVRWVAPQLVCEVEFRDWTGDGLVRAASFKGLREDRPAEEVVLERELPRGRKAQPGIAGLQLTHPDRLLWAGAGVTKQGLAEFYADIADLILPHIAGRPLSLLRCPSGTDAPCFFAKNPWAGLSESVRPVKAGKTQPALVIEDLAGLFSLVQAGVVEIHPWGSTVEEIDRPDRLFFDLDPAEDVPWRAVIDAALEVRTRLADLGLTSFVKTSGGKGLHVVVPVVPSLAWDEAKAFTRSIASAMAKTSPDRYLDRATKHARRGRIYIDYVRNGLGATAVAAYSTRANPQAAVSTPLAWDELSDSIRAGHFTVGNLRHRLRFLQQDPWPGFFALRQRIPTAQRQAPA